MKIEGRTFIVSGGASGLGQASIEMICENGGCAAILDKTEDLGKQVAASLGSAAKFFPCDVCDSKSVETAVKGAAEWAKQTGKPISGVITAAGVSMAKGIVDDDGNILNMDDWDFVLNINLRGTVEVIRQSIVHMLKNEPAPPDGERGVVIMVSSSAADDGSKSLLAYSASKGAISSMAIPMSRDLAPHGMRAVSIAPGLFYTGMTKGLPKDHGASLQPMRQFPPRGGQPAEFAALAKHIIENVMLNGTVLRINGGTRPRDRLQD